MIGIVEFDHLSLLGVTKADWLHHYQVKLDIMLVIRSVTTNVFACNKTWINETFWSYDQSSSTFIALLDGSEDKIQTTSMPRLAVNPVTRMCGDGDNVAQTGLV